MSTHARLSRSGPAVLRNRRIIIAYLLFTLAALLAPRVAEADLNPSTLPPDAETVLITEFVASPNSRENSNTLRDADGEASDWIELFNPSDSPIDLTGWRLTDRENDLRRWKFPNGVRIAAQDYLVVFASGKDRWEADGELHTNFSLKREGEYLALIDPNDNVVSDYGIPYPMQYTGVSYGVVEESGLPNRYGDLAHYMVQPTPGLPNGSAHGPVIRDVDHMPAPLTTGHDLRVSATVLADAPLVDVTLHYRIGYGDEQRIPMRSFIPSSYLADIPTPRTAGGRSRALLHNGRSKPCAQWLAQESLAIALPACEPAHAAGGISGCRCTAGEDLAACSHDALALSRSQARTMCAVRNTGGRSSTPPL